MDPSFKDLPIHAFPPIYTIEDVFTRFINLPDQEREHAIIFADHRKHPDFQNKEVSLMALFASDTTAAQKRKRCSFSTCQELHQEICRLQQQLQMAEEQIRMYEPDPLKITSMEEMDSYEKNLVDTLATVMQRKEYLLSSQLSSYEPSGVPQMFQGSFENTITSWMPNSNAQIFDGSASLDTFRELASTVYDPFSQGTSSNVDPNSMGGECHVPNASDGDHLQAWPQPYPPTSTGQLPSLLPPTLYPQIQHGLGTSDMAGMNIPHQHMEIPIGNSNVGADNNIDETANFGNEVSS
ncbi:hypothetical protein TIFTF001_014451 [Ficus carica]|uniref:Uncharacterized protein n=1 Tax=Ficus carica TaxID=3494 RepID=A0AA88A639_FICCA|nr:hypothetical protein TIFTF001_014451 [Ficus carica]